MEGNCLNKRKLKDKSAKEKQKQRETVVRKREIAVKEAVLGLD